MMMMLLLKIADDRFHAILDLQLAFLEGDLFDLLGLGQVGLGDEFVQAILELVMLGGEVVELLVRLQQQCLEVL
jgi:hypothetical protein